MVQPNLSTGHFEKAYKLLEKLGEGSFGFVFKAEHSSTGTAYAVKIVKIETEKVLKESLREVQALESLEDPNIVPYKTSWLEKINNDKKKFPMNLFIVMGLGIKTLEEWLEEHKDEQSRKSFPTNLWLEQLVDGVAHIHRKGMMHRDLKPANILLFSGCEGFTLKISDFGLAKNTVDENGDGIKHTGWRGTPEYMAPEQDKGNKKYTKAVDLYSLGLISMEILFVMNDEETSSVFRARFKGETAKLPTSRWRKMEIPIAFLFCLTDIDPDMRLKYMDILARGGSDKKRTGARMFFSPKKPNPPFWPTIVREGEEFSKKTSEKLDDFIEKEASKVTSESYPPCSHKTGYFEKEYEKLGTLGSGSFSVVFKARLLTDNTEYAVKQVRIEEGEDWEEILGEVKSHTALKHQNIVTYNDWWLEQFAWNQTTGRSEFYLYIAMELGNETLEKWLEKNPNKEDRNLDRTKLWMQQLKDGLDYIHKEKIIHCDLKPSNIFLFHADDTAVLKISDSARDEDGYALVQTTGKMGTKLYLAPELINGRRPYDKTVDIYSLGLIFIEMVFPMNQEDKERAFEMRRNGGVPEVLKIDNGNSAATKLLKEALLGMTDGDSYWRLEVWSDHILFWVTGKYSTPCVPTPYRAVPEVDDDSDDEDDDDVFRLFLLWTR